MPFSPLLLAVPVGGCNVLAGDQTATFASTNITAPNPGGLGSNWYSSVHRQDFELI
jgi:hypothetical protein